jgi:hypothetical protein
LTDDLLVQYGAVDRKVVRHTWGGIIGEWEDEGITNDGTDIRADIGLRIALVETLRKFNKKLKSSNGAIHTAIL